MSLADQSSVKPRRGWRLPSPWSVGAALIAALVVAPILAVFWIALFPAENIWPHLVSTTLPRYLSNTLVLMFGVG
ncbi:iron ABC transporter permease, partial [Salipiger sp. HF18]|nr:iron ABC transporter permease [Salipiger sp. HF18]